MSDHATDTPQTPFRRRLSRVLDAMRDLRLLERKSETVTARLNPDLLQMAKRRAGVESNSALVEIAIANLAAEDGFPEAFDRARGRVPADIDLGI